MHLLVIEQNCSCLKFYRFSGTALIITWLCIYECFFAVRDQDITNFDKLHILNIENTIIQMISLYLLIHINRY